MSDYGLFEADEVAANEPRRQARTAARHLDAAIHEVRRGFGRFLMGATGIDEFEDRWHLSKADIRSTVEPHVFPNTGTMRRIQNAMKADWKVAHPYKLAEDRDAPIVDIDETFHPDSGNLIPEGNFSGYQDSVDQNGPEKVQNAFTSGTDREAAKLVADIYTDFARSNGMRVASLETLDRYASTGIHDADYSLLQSLIVAACECDDDEEGGDEKEAPKASESDSDDDSDDDSEAPDFGGESDSEGSDEGSEDDESDDSDSPESESDGGDEEYDFGGDDTGDDDPGMGDAGGEQFTVPEQAPELEPQLLNEIPHDDPQGAAPVPPEVIDSLLGLPEGTIEQLLLEEVQQGQGGGDGFGGPPQGGPPPAGPEQGGAPQGGAPQGGGEDFFGGGGDDAEQEPPRVARRRQAKEKLTPFGTKPTKPDTAVHRWQGDEYLGEVPEEENWNPQHKKSEAARRFWAAEEEPSGGDGGGGEAAAPPAQDPAAAGGAPPMDPAAMAQPQLPPPGSQAVAPPAPAQPLENQPAEDALLDTANQAIMQMIDRETQEYQQIIDPLSQALQAVQFAQQVEQSEHPMDVTPPQGSVNVDPSAAPGGAQNPMQPTARRRQAIFQTWPSEEAYRRNIEDSRHAEEARNAPPVAPPRFSDEDVEYLKGLGQNPDQAGGGFPDWDSYHKFHGASRQAKIRTALRGAARVIAQKYRLSATGERMLLEAMGRRNYEHVREALSLVPPEVRKPAAIHMGEMFAADNARFNKDAWMKSVLASNPRDRAGDAWRDGRDRGVAEHGQHDMDEVNYRDPEYLRSQIGKPTGESYPRFDGDGNEMAPGTVHHRASRGRLPFDRPRLAGETLVPTPTMDAFEFPGQGEVPRVSDNNTSNELPVMKGADPHGKNAAWARQANDIAKKLQNWMAQQQARGLNYGGDTAAEGFLNTRKKPLGPRATQMVHQQVGAESHPEAEVAVPKVKAPRAVNPVTKKGSFFTRKVSGWKWDDHLSGYLSKEARAFTCACGEKVAAPSYKTCKCGTTWNVYALGDTHHLASDTADLFIAREIKPGVGMILAGKNMEHVIPSGDGDMASGSGSGRVRGVQPRTGSQRGSNSSASEFWSTDSSGSGAQGEHSGQSSRLSNRRTGTEQHQDGSLVGGSGLPRTAGGSAGSSPERRSARQSSGEPGLRDGKGQHGGHGSSRDTVAAAENALPRRTSSGGTQPGSQPGAARTSAVPGVPAGAQLAKESSRGRSASGSGSVLPETLGRVAQKSHRELLAEIDKLADWTIYDDEDPSRQGGPKKPPSTKVPTGDAKWHSRNSDGKYLSPATFPPKKK